jgi:predicted lactoylglutathione lyase
LHVAFEAASRAAVDDFYVAAIQAGGVDRGAPGLRQRYADNWYAAFVLDPDGHNIESVCQR